MSNGILDLQGNKPHNLERETRKENCIGHEMFGLKTPQLGQENREENWDIES